VLRALAVLSLLAFGTNTSVSAQDRDRSEEEAVGEEEEEEVVQLRPEDLSDEEYLARRGRHCAGRYKEQWVLSQLFAAQSNPDGAYNQLRLGMCFPLIRTPGILFDYTNVEIGMINELTPAFTHLGGYAQIAPLSFLVFRVEASGLVYWPLPLKRTGYNPVYDGYDSGFESDDFEAGAGRVQTGWNMNLITTLRAKVALSPVWSILLLSILNVGYWEIGEGYYVNIRWDVVMNDSDWIIADEAFLGAEARATDAFALRFGAFDSWRGVPSSGYTANQVGGFAMLWWPRPFPNVWDFTIMARLGYYTDHAFRTDSFSVLGGLVTKYELGGI
jgi:hypothetical protein